MGALSDLQLQYAPDRANSELKITLCVPRVLDTVRVTYRPFFLHLCNLHQHCKYVVQHKKHPKQIIPQIFKCFTTISLLDGD